jgi:hypothetical protein
VLPTSAQSVIAMDCVFLLENGRKETDWSFCACALAFGSRSPIRPEVVVQWGQDLFCCGGDRMCGGRSGIRHDWLGRAELPPFGFGPVRSSSFVARTRHMVRRADHLILNCFCRSVYRCPKGSFMMGLAILLERRSRIILTGDASRTLPNLSDPLSPTPIDPVAHA